MFEFFLLMLLIKNFVNDNDSYWLGQLIYLFMIDEHIILVEFGSNSFNATCDFNTKTRSLKEEIFMNWNVWDEWYNGKENMKYVASWVTICWAFIKALFKFWIFKFASILFAMHFLMIKCRSNVIDLPIFVIYDVQYVITAYGSKINWISIYANHKWATCI